MRDLQQNISVMRNMQLWEERPALSCIITYSINRMLNYFPAVSFLSEEVSLNFFRVSKPHVYKDKLFLSGVFFLIFKEQPYLLHLSSNHHSSCRPFLLQNTSWEPPPTLTATRAVDHQQWEEMDLVYRRGCYQIISSYLSLYLNKNKCK